MEWETNQIYKIKKEDWDAFFLKEIHPLYKVGFDLEGLVYKETLFLPNEVMDCVHKFSQDCLSFVTTSTHYDSGLIIKEQENLQQLYFDVVNILRKDLKIEIIDEALKNRMLNSI